MDIIAVHQQGLIEQLKEEVGAIAGRGRDHCQRAVVLHHLFDHSRGAHAWALAEARRELRIARGLEALAKTLDRWGWLCRRKNEARQALAQFNEALGEASRQRCAGAYFAYRMSATPALRREAGQQLPAELLGALEQCHASRRAGNTVSGDAVAALVRESELLAQATADGEAVQAAWAAIGATWLRRKAVRLLGPKALAGAEARDRRRGSARVERELRGDPLLPASFRANPAQHFYALQHALAERRRQQWREACDQEPDSFELAA